MFVPLAWGQEDECGKCQMFVNGNCTPCYEAKRECISGLCVPPEMSNGEIEELQKAERGNADSIYLLAVEHLKQKQFRKALLHYREYASKNKGASAYFVLGSFLAGALSADGSLTHHELEKGAIPQKYIDYQEAEKWLLEATKTGNKCVKNLLGRMYARMGKYYDSLEWSMMCMQEEHHQDSAAYQIGQIWEQG